MDMHQEGTLSAHFPHEEGDKRRFAVLRTVRQCEDDAHTFGVGAAALSASNLQPKPLTGKHQGR